MMMKENGGIQQSTKNQELSNCYFVKAILMIIVVLYHSLAFWMPGGWFNQEPVEKSEILGMAAMWLNSFHIYAFTFVSGYIFYAMKYEYGKYQGYLDFIINKAKRLLIPYCFVSIIWVIPMYIIYFGKDNCVLKDIVKKYILMESPAQLWFLIMLFGVFILYYPAADWINRDIKKGMFFSIIMYGLGIICNHFLPNFFQIWTVFRFMIFFYMGVTVRKNGMGVLMKIPVYIYVLCDLILFICYELILSKAGIFWKLTMVVIGFLLHIIGALGSFVILQKLVQRMKHTSLLNFCSKHSMTIYLFHQQLIYITLTLGNGHINNYCLAMINFLFSLAGASIISMILYRFPLTRYLVTGKSNT